MKPPARHKPSKPPKSLSPEVASLVELFESVPPFRALITLMESSSGADDPLGRLTATTVYVLLRLHIDTLHPHRPPARYEETIHALHRAVLAVATIPPSDFEEAVLNALAERHNWE